MKTTVKFSVIYSTLLVLLVGMAGCTNKKPNVELIQDMMESPAVKAQEDMRVPPEGTVPIGFRPYRHHFDPATAEKVLVNPVAVNAATLERGKNRYEIYCLVCHGAGGAGDGTVAEKMPVRPPSLLSDKVRKFNDGRIFHIISDGQGVMGSYASQIPSEQDRWSVVNYVRSLQKAK